MSAQSKNPTKVMPMAVVLTVFITAGLSMLAAAALSGMVPYYKMGGGDFGFAVALKMNGAYWSAAIVEVRPDWSVAGPCCVPIGPLPSCAASPQVRGHRRG
eukprot:9485603-Pyramimonas_sp.AAC.1